MTKADLIDEVAKNSELSKKDAEAIVQAVLDSIVESLKSAPASMGYTFDRLLRYDGFQ